MEHTVLSWLSDLGAPALFALLALGVVGLPIPDETLLVVAGALVHEGRMNPLTTAVAALGGSMSGITISYSVGRIAGLAFVHRFGRFIHVDDAVLDRAHRWFDRMGKWLLTICYFIPGVRHFAALVAGTSCLSTRTFALFAYSGAVLWTGCFLGIGYALGDQWPDVVQTIHRHTLAVVAVAAAIGAAYYLLVWRRTRSHS